MPRRVIEQFGPMLTSELSKKVAEKYELTPVNARKRVERAVTDKKISVLKSVRFAHNQNFAYLPEETGSKLYYERLFKALSETKSKLRLPLAALRGRGGLIPEVLFPVLTGCPISSARKVDSSKMLLKLLDLNLVKRQGTFIRLATEQKDRAEQLTRLQATLHVEDIFISTFANWLRLQRLIGDIQNLRFDEIIPQFGFYQWDLVAPSYILPLATFKNQKQPGFVVADVSLGRSLTSYEVEYFLEKCKEIRVHSNNRPFLAFMIADWFEQDALDLAQTNGVIFTTPKNLFGSRFSDALDTFRKVLEKKEEEIDAQAMRIDELLLATDELGLLQALSDNLKGYLFELIVGHCYSKLYGGSVVHGKHFKDVKDSNRLLDCDVLQISENHAIRGCECKGGKTEVKIDDAKKWIQETVPAIRQTYFDAEAVFAIQEFAIWTSASFDDESRAYMHHLKSTCQKFSVDYKDGAEVWDIVKKCGDPRIKEAYERWFRANRRGRKPRSVE